MVTLCVIYGRRVGASEFLSCPVVYLDTRVVCDCVDSRVCMCVGVWACECFLRNEVREGGREGSVLG